MKIKFIYFNELLLHASELWDDGKAFELIDSAITNPSPSEEAEHYIQVRLMYFQLNATDEPSMSSNLFLLSNEAEVLSPKQSFLNFLPIYKID